MQQATLRVSMLLCWALAGSLHELRAADEAAAESKSAAGHSMPIEWATWSPDGTRIATAARDRQILIWDV